MGDKRQGLEEKNEKMEVGDRISSELGEEETKDFGEKRYPHGISRRNL